MVWFVMWVKCWSVLVVWVCRVVCWCVVRLCWFCGGGFLSRMVNFLCRFICVLCVRVMWV